MRAPTAIHPKGECKGGEKGISEGLRGPHRVRRGPSLRVLAGATGPSPATVRNAIVNSATRGVLSGVGSGSPNLLLYSLFGSAPPPPPPPSGCSLAESYNGSLSGTGDSDIHPGGTYFYSSRSGTHRGCVRGPSGTDFDLYLYRRNGFNW
ncbi:MAG: hypothetical protein GEU68_01705, partial [Actinobacteria bacterium]|nr:hypothetical protein [Actinomycetota bacterium]